LNRLLQSKLLRASAFIEVRRDLVPDVRRTTDPVVHDLLSALVAVLLVTRVQHGVKLKELNQFEKQTRLAKYIG
jgi:hypothetical protein